MIKSTDYHDYVFRDGRLVGEFEEMYRNSKGTPWHQDEQENWMDVRLTQEMIRDLGVFSEIHDLGCGTGHYLDLISAKFLAPGGKSFGYDVSETACKKASEIFQESVFVPLDLTERTTNNEQRTTNNEQRTTNNEQRTTTRRLFMIRGTLWYVFPKLTAVIDNIKNLMSDSDRLLVVQNFPPLEKAFIGKEVIPNHLALIDHFSRRFALDRHMWFEDRFKSANDNWFIGLFSMKD